MPHLIHIAGMHRSGTSAIARVLNLLGVSLGDESGLLPPGPDNVKGYWEQAPILRLNERLLDHLGGSWDHPPVLRQGWERADWVEPWRAEAIGVLNGIRSGEADLALKDPRISILMPFWQSVEPPTAVVLPIRSPRAVAQSLHHRNGFEEDKAAYLWLRYVCGALAGAPRALVVAYDDLMSDPAATALRLHEALGLAGSPDLAPITEFIDDDLDHASDDRGSNSRLVEMAQSLFDSVTRNEPSAVAVAQAFMDMLSHASDDLTSLHERSNQQQITSLATVVRDAQRQLQNFLKHDLQQSVVALDRTAASLRQDNAVVVASRQQAKAAQTALAQTKQQLREAQEGRRKQEDEKVALRRRLNNTKDQLAEARAKARNSRAELRGTRQELRALREELRSIRVRKSVRLALGLADTKIAGRVRSSLWRNQPEQLQNPAEPANVNKPASRRGIAQDPREVSKRSDERGRTSRRGGKRPSEVAPKSRSFGPAAEVHEDFAAAAQGLDLLAALDVHVSDPVTVIVPVYNALYETKACVASVLRHTKYPYRLLVVNDASTDAAVAPFLASLEARREVTVLTNEENLGFTKSVNRALQSSTSDVVLLNSDTVVGPMWLRSLAFTAYERRDRGTVTAVSNSAGAFSVPQRAEKELPASVDFAQLARAFVQDCRRVAWTPTANGFCMYIKRALIDSIGLLDEDNFPRGYGEENDFSMRAMANGFHNAVAGRVLVYHAGSRSFGTGEGRTALMKEGTLALDRLHPTYKPLVQRFLKSEEMKRIRKEAHAVFRKLGEESPKVRLMHVAHAGMGGVPRFMQDVAEHAGDRFESFVLRSDGQQLTLSAYRDGGEETLESVVLNAPVRYPAVRHEEYLGHVVRWVDRYGIEVAHLQHLIGHPLALSWALDKVGIPTLATLHDYFLICPTIHLLDDRMDFCGGTCTDSPGDCRPGYPWLRQGAVGSPLKRHWVYEWQGLMATHVLPYVRIVTAPSESVLRVFANVFPQKSEVFTLVPHGFRELERSDANPPDNSSVQGRPLRVLLLGNLNEQKGLGSVAEAMEMDATDQIDLHLLGSVAPKYDELGTQHGPYDSTEVLSRIRDIAPDVVLVPSLSGETHCYTLTEAWLAGVPTLVSDVGALKERVEAGEGAGWTFAVGDARELLQALYRLKQDPELLVSAREKLRAYAPRSAQEMGRDYRDLYLEMMGLNGPAGGPLAQLIAANATRIEGLSVASPSAEYLVLTSDRQALDRLSASLVGSPLGAPRDWFNPHFVASNARALCAGTLEDYVARLKAQSSNDIFGLGLTARSLEAFSREGDLEHWFDLHAPTLVLFRESVVEHAVSLYVAERRTVLTSAAMPDRHDPVYDRSEIEARIERILAEEDSLQALVRDRSLSPRFLSYERLAEFSPDDIRTAMCTMVGVEPPTSPLMSKEPTALTPVLVLEQSRRFESEDPEYVAHIESRRTWLRAGEERHPLIPLATASVVP